MPLVCSIKWSVFDKSWCVASVGKNSLLNRQYSSTPFPMSPHCNYPGRNEKI